MSKHREKRRKQDDTTEQDIDHEGQKAKAVGTVRPHLPDSVVHQILQFLPTKSAVRMSILAKQWEGVWSSFPGLDFEEDDEQLDDRNLEKLGHSRFISFLEKCLEDFRVKNEKVLEKPSLRVRRYSPRDDTDIVDRFLNFAFDRSVKGLDISLRSECGVERYRLAPQTFLNAKSIAALNLEHVTLYYQFGRQSPSNPFLKTLSLKSVHISKECLLSYIITACPSIEYLSLTSCYIGSIRVSSSILKSLEVMHCWSDS